jgi:hypothetical protein
MAGYKFLLHGLSDFTPPISVRGNLQFSIVKAIPVEAWTGPEGSSRLRLSDFKRFGT